MNTVSLLFSDMTSTDSIQPSSGGSQWAGSEGVEVKVPLDICHFLKRASNLIKDERADITRTSTWNNSSRTIAQASIELSAMPSSLWEILGDIKKVSYRLGWLDGQNELRRKFMDSLKRQFDRKEKEYTERLMKLSHLLNWKNAQISRMTGENEKLQLVSDFLFEKSESLEVALAEANVKIAELAEFLEKSKARETKLARMLTQSRSECDELKEYLEDSKCRETKLAGMLAEERSRSGKRAH